MSVQKRWEIVVKGNLVDADGITLDGWLAIEQGKIAATGSGPLPQAEKVIDASGRWVIPGVIDGQVHSGSQANQEGLGWASRAAAAGGVTVMVDMPYDDPEPVASRGQLENKIAEVERDCHVDVALFGTLNQKHGFEAAAGLIEGGVCAFKFSTFEATPGRFPRVEEDDLLHAFQSDRPERLSLRGAQSDAGDDAQKHPAHGCRKRYRLGRVHARAYSPDRRSGHRADCMKSARLPAPAPMRSTFQPRAGLRSIKCTKTPAIRSPSKPAFSI
ncbi:hypothetical protein ACQFN5_15320 [Klebsiella sp. WOUb02]|uniref:hypothetical protein n=1 Tax=Klebsiella sp. WOUb02 TaxID=3161071 RepID=UPI003CE81CFA